jgi:hypothetical protein
MLPMPKVCPYRSNRQTKSIRGNGGLSQPKSHSHRNVPVTPRDHRATLTQNLRITAFGRSLLHTHLVAEGLRSGGQLSDLPIDDMADLLDRIRGNDKNPAEADAISVISAVISANLLRRRINLRACRVPNSQAGNSLHFGLPPSTRSSNERAQPSRDPKR